MMPTLRTITTIELSSICNLSCKYCINRYMKERAHREPMIMEHGVFLSTLTWVEALVKKGTQREVNLNGNGESTLDPDLIIRIRKLKDIMGELPVQFTTNGIGMTQELAFRLKDSGIDRVDISAHHIPSAITAQYHLRNPVHGAGIPGGVTLGHVVTPHNWAGQLPVVPTVDIPILCHPFMEGRGYVQAEGDVVPCCYDYRNLGAYGHVFDPDLLEKEMYPFALCMTCHQHNPYVKDQREKVVSCEG